MPDPAALQEELLAVMARGVDAPLPETEFNRLALAVFAHQWRHNAPYGAVCRARGAGPDTVTHWSEIPALPTDAFKYADLTTVPPEAVGVTYLTSGTTRSEERRGRHLLPDTRLYDASLLPNFRAHVLPDRDSICVLVCGPTARFFPHSSLGHMHSLALERFGAPGSGLFWRDDGPRFGCLSSALRKVERDAAPVALLGTGFGLVHFLDYLEREGQLFRLPPGSRIMDTGGYKGRSREVPRAELYALYDSRLGVPLAHVVNEYGMTELGSQFYDDVLRRHLAGDDHSVPVERRRKVPPPWVRTRVGDPDTLEPLPPGEVGLLRHYDLANLHTLLAVQTDDLGVARDGGFEILGRAAGAAPRGCSLAMEDLP